MDEDYLTENWKPRLELEPTPENYAEWAVMGGLDATTRRRFLLKQPSVMLLRVQYLFQCQKSSNLLCD